MQVAVDAIVNAANDQLLGCRLPNHACIDNAIHSAAGPHLREACAAVVARHGLPEPVGRAKLTPAYALPAQFVLHTVGPQLRPGTSPTPTERRQLYDCYAACLDTAAAQPAIRSLAFCGISTGVFAFPKPAAARIALHAIADGLARHPDRFDRLVIDAFTEADAHHYRHALTTWSTP